MWGKSNENHIPCDWLYRVWYEGGKRVFEIDAIVDAPSPQDAIVKATDEALYESDLLTLYDETTESVMAVEVVGERLEAYEAQQATQYQRQYSEPLFVLTAEQ